MDPRRAHELRDLVNRLDKRTEGAGVHRDVLLDRLDELGMAPEEAVSQLNEWYAMGEAYLPAPDRVRMTDYIGDRTEEPFAEWV